MNAPKVRMHSSHQLIPCSLVGYCSFGGLFDFKIQISDAKMVDPHLAPSSQVPKRTWGF